MKRRDFLRALGKFAGVAPAAVPAIGAVLAQRQSASVGDSQIDAWIRAFYDLERAMERDFVNTMWFGELIPPMEYSKEPDGRVILCYTQEYLAALNAALNAALPLAARLD